MQCFDGIASEKDKFANFIDLDALEAEVGSLSGSVIG